MKDIFDFLEVAQETRPKVTVNWDYDEQNERVVELPEEFRKDCSFPFQINRQVE